MIYFLVAFFVALCLLGFIRWMNHIDQKMEQDYDEFLEELEETVAPNPYKKWGESETEVAAFLALNAEEYLFGKDISEFARAIGRTEGSLESKARRLRTIEGKPQAPSDIGESVYGKLKELSFADQKVRVYNTLSVLAYEQEEFELSTKFAGIALQA